VQVEGEPTEEALEQLRRGVHIKDAFTAPAEASLLPEQPAQVWERSKPVRFRANIPTSWIELTITEGMNRQVRKMTAAVGFPTLRLIRARIASVSIGKLAPGQWRDLTDSEVQELKRLTATSQQAGGSAPARKKPTEKYDPNFEQKVAARKAAQANKAAAGKFGPPRGPKSAAAGGRSSRSADGAGAGGRGSRPAGAAPRAGKPGGSPAPRSGGKAGGAGTGRSSSGSGGAAGRPPRRSK
jgi:23S rRNA pseudouridine2457 synthase